MRFAQLPKLSPGDKVAILSPSFAAPGKWPHVYELGLSRLRGVFGLEPVEFPTTKRVGASTEDRAKDLIAAFEDPQIKGVITTLGGSDQVTYVKNLPTEPFANNPKPFFGYSDNSHFANHLWLCGIPSYYGGGLFNQFAMQEKMDDVTVKYLKRALFEGGEVELDASPLYNDIGLNWDEPENLNKARVYEENAPWAWDGSTDAEGILWGGCLESVDEMLRHGVRLPTLERFEEVILILETSEEIPTKEYVWRVMRALGGRGILGAVKGILVGRPKAWEFDKQWDAERKALFRERQQETILEVARTYNPTIPVVQNLDFGHTDPQIAMPLGQKARIVSSEKKIFAQF